jgi:hypothetical protein
MANAWGLMAGGEGVGIYYWECKNTTDWYSLYIISLNNINTYNM